MCLVFGTRLHAVQVSHVQDLLLVQLCTHKTDFQHIMFHNSTPKTESPPPPKMERGSSPLTDEFRDRGSEVPGTLPLLPITNDTFLREDVDGQWTQKHASSTQPKPKPPSPSIRHISVIDSIKPRAAPHTAVHQVPGMPHTT